MSKDILTIVGEIKEKYDLDGIHVQRIREGNPESAEWESEDWKKLKKRIEYK